MDWSILNRTEPGNGSSEPRTIHTKQTQKDEIQKKEKENNKKCAKSAYVSTRKLNDCPLVGFLFFFICFE